MLALTLVLFAAPAAAAAVPGQQPPHPPAPSPRVVGKGSDDSLLRFSPRPNRAAEIHWRPFGPDAFAEATATHKPIFLNLAAIWCHWCHVFDETTLSDPQVIALLNDKFVPMRVDADQNPQVERRYLLGGWPTNAFLDDHGQILGGGTYIPPERFLPMARLVAEGYPGDREKLAAQLGANPGTPRDETAPGALDPRLAEKLGQQLRGSIDREHGGFGGAPKFPQADGLALLAYLGETRGDAPSLEDARSSLAKMGQGEILDRVEGGFFRYALRADWSEPHYEKMLATNAELLLALAETYAATHDEAIRGEAMSIAGYLVSHLWDEKAGGFLGSQDADERYYRLDAAGRGKLPPPPLDRTFLADRMALASRALVRAARVFGEPDLADYAQRNMALVLARMRTPDGGVFHALADAPDARPTLPNALGDQAQVALALLDLASYSGDDADLRAAAEILGAAQRNLGDASAPGFFDVPADPHAVGLVAHRVKPLEENALLAWALFRLGEVTGNDALIARARETLSAFAGNARGLGAADFARAADAVGGQSVRLIIVGPGKHAATRALLHATHELTDPRLEVRVLAKGDRLGSLSFPTGAPAAYACTGTTCSRPMRDAQALPGELQRFIAAQLR